MLTSPVHLLITRYMSFRHLRRNLKNDVQVSRQSKGLG
jgi:hypothetical protein